jgi:hypothetical protein
MTEMEKSQKNNTMSSRVAGPQTRGYFPLGKKPLAVAAPVEVFLWHRCCFGPMGVFPRPQIRIPRMILRFGLRGRRWRGK